MSQISFESLSPVLPVDQIEPCLSLWTERLGFTEVARVPDTGERVFSMLTNGNVTVMYQTRASIEKDEPALRERPLGSAALYVRVNDVAEVIQRVRGANVIGEPRDTFYGMREIAVREHGGHVITFAQSING
jgi:uncharacterized glyoxalase superfamily protein PhnB